MSDLDEIRRKRMEQIQQQIAAQQQQQSGPNIQQQMQQQQMQQEMEQQKKEAMRQILTPEARERLNNLRLTRKDLVDSLEIELIQLAQAGRIKLPVTDSQLKQILQQAAGSKREIHITRK
jgi:programmed cell death protein 5